MFTDSLGQLDPTDTLTIPIKVDTVVFPKPPDPDTTSIIRLPKGSMQQWKIFPNPTKDKVFLELAGFEGKPSEITILLYDEIGKIMWQKAMKAEKEAIDLSPYAPGVYFIRIRYGGVDIGGEKVIRR